MPCETRSSGVGVFSVKSDRCRVGCENERGENCGSQKLGELWQWMWAVASASIDPSACQRMQPTGIANTKNGTSASMQAGLRRWLYASRQSPLFNAWASWLKLGSSGVNGGSREAGCFGTAGSFEAGSFGTGASGGVGSAAGEAPDASAALEAACAAVAEGARPSAAVAPEAFSCSPCLLACILTGCCGLQAELQTLVLK